MTTKDGAQVDVTKMTLEELSAEQARLAEERTAVRLRQNAVTAEIEIRNMLDKTVSGATREALILRLGGGITPTGDTAAEEVKA